MEKYTFENLRNEKILEGRLYSRPKDKTEVRFEYSNGLVGTDQVP